jgi:hypothetical protein
MSSSEFKLILINPIRVIKRYSRMKIDQPQLRAAYDAGLKSGQREGVPDQCPFEIRDRLSERFAWLSGFSVGKAIRTLK